MHRRRTQPALSALALIWAILGLPGGVAAEPWPYWPFDAAHGLGNHFGEYQNYGGSPYYHDGIDLVTPAGPVACYSVAPGTVTHLTYNDPYYSGIMIGDPVPNGLGWLYWHINSTTFQFDIGDPVGVNDYIGTVAWWPVSSFHHVHFNRVRGTGGYPWSWYVAIDNPLLYLEPHGEPDPPLFHTTYQGEKFAFARQGSGQLLASGSLSGDVDIVSRISDIVGLSQWALNPWKIDYWIDGAVQSVPLTNTVTFSGEIPASGTVGVIYRTVAPLNTQGDYNYRIFYFNITNTDGDGVVETSDANYYWDTDLCDPGDYWVYVRAADIAGNVVTESMRCTVAGAVDVDFDLPETAHDFGTVPVTLTDTWELPILNHGTDHLSVRAIASDNSVFSVDREHFYVPPGGVEVVRVTFAPTAVEDYAGTLEITTNDPLHPVGHVALTGSGGDPSAVAPDDRHAQPAAGACGALDIVGVRPIPGAGAEIVFRAPAAAETEVVAFDLSGRCVRRAALAARGSDIQRWTWDGRDQSGEMLAGGIYFIRLRAGGQCVSRAALLMR